MDSEPGLERRVAILYQAAPPPPVNGIRKPMKPGGYRDAGADIAYTLSRSSASDITVVTPAAAPAPEMVEGWTFPDTEAGILDALEKGANVLWANTILFSSHPLQVSPALEPYLDRVRVVGQPPSLVEVGDDKEFVNGCLRRRGGFTLPRGWGVASVGEIDDLAGLSYPVVAKPVRGRGSFGVKVCETRTELEEHVKALLRDSSRVMLEEFLSGQEATVAVMPPCPAYPEYIALLPVVRVGHRDGVAPWNGTVAVTVNSRVVAEQEMEQDGSWGQVMRECEETARSLGATAMIRIDVRRFGETGKFALFDVNMKPNLTGSGRPGRDDQTSLCGIAASGLGWDYERLLAEMLNSARQLRELRNFKPALT